MCRELDSLSSEVLKVVVFLGPSPAPFTANKSHTYVVFGRKPLNELTPSLTKLPSGPASSTEEHCTMYIMGPLRSRGGKECHENVTSLAPTSVPKNSGAEEGTTDRHNITSHIFSMHTDSYSSYHIHFGLQKSQH